MTTFLIFATIQELDKANQKKSRKASFLDRRLVITNRRKHGNGGDSSETASVLGMVRRFLYGYGDVHRVQA